MVYWIFIRAGATAIQLDAGSGNILIQHTSKGTGYAPTVYIGRNPDAEGAGRNYSIIEYKRNLVLLIC